jgi:hypothetical protein
MADGSKKKASGIRKGDAVRCMDGTAKVVCVLKTDLFEARKLIALGSHLKITPWHPVLIDGKWMFPSKITGGIKTLYDGEALYSFLLDQGHTMIIGSLVVICLGHGFKADVARHPFLGTEKVVEAMKMMKGFEEGLITIWSTTRGEDGLINGFICDH